jgi:hypothetical protein
LCHCLWPRIDLAAFINQRFGAPMRPIDPPQICDPVPCMDIPGALT